MVSDVLGSDLRSSIAARAASLNDRRARAAIRGPVDDDAVSAAARLVEFWNWAYSPSDDAAFRRRLAWDGLTREQALSLVAAEHATFGAPPEWTEWLSRFFASAQEVLSQLHAGTLDEPISIDEPPFVELWIALLVAARSELSARIPPRIREQVGERAMRALDRQLLAELSRWGERAVFEQFQEHLAAEVSTDCRSSAETAPYRRFVSAVLETGFVRLWNRWPVLARDLSTVVGCWVDSTTELLLRLNRDRDAIAAAFASHADLGRLIGLRPGLSDPHDGRRRVAALEFECGLHVVYKPRDLGLDRVFADVVRWLADRALEPAPKALHVLERDGYGWAEFVTVAPQRSREQARGYFRQTGSLLCLAYLLGTRDLHMDNVIATADGPVLVDLEMLCQPDGQTGHGAVSQAPDEARFESCLLTGLLHMYEAGPNDEIFDVGGLAGDGTGVRTRPKRVWQGLRTAGLRFTENLTFATPPANRVIAEGSVMAPGEHAVDIIAGFEETYRLILAERERLIAPDGPLASLSACKSRVVLRPTDQYAQLCDVLAAPRYQGNGMRRSAAMDVLLRPFSRNVIRPALWPVLVEERRALEALDIPRFSIACDGTDVSAGDRPVPGVSFAQSGESAVRSRLGRFSSDDLARQCQELTRALGESPRSRFASPFPAQRANAAPSQQLFLDTAMWVGDELLAHSLHGVDGLAGASLSSPSICPHALYDGAGGGALLFAALHSVTRENRWAEAARAAVEPIHRSVARGEFARWRGNTIGIGDGLGSVVYALLWTGTLLHEDKCLDAASELARLLAARVDSCDRDDLLSGTAGGILALLALHGVRRDDQTLRSALTCGSRLVARLDRIAVGGAWPARDGTQLTGFAHGVAGIVYALERLHELTGRPEIAEAAARGRRIVTDRFLPAAANWAVSDARENDQKVAIMVAWCHGAPGIALALAHRGEHEPDAQLDAALATTAHWFPGGADYLCCGALGRAEVLLTLGQWQSREGAVEAARSLATKVVERARRHGHFRLSTPGPDYRVFDPGFFRGLSGIGYALLRQAAPEALPAILAFQAPPARDRVDGDLSATRPLRDCGIVSASRI